jgi:hypothetical protein
MRETGTIKPWIRRYIEILRQLITTMGCVPIVVVVEVPWSYFATGGISSRRDVD